MAVRSSPAVPSRILSACLISIADSESLGSISKVYGGARSYGHATVVVGAAAVGLLVPIVVLAIRKLWSNDESDEERIHDVFERRPSPPAAAAAASGRQPTPPQVLRQQTIKQTTNQSQTVTKVPPVTLPKPKSPNANPIRKMADNAEKVVPMTLRNFRGAQQQLSSTTAAASSSSSSKTVSPSSLISHKRPLTYNGRPATEAFHKATAVVGQRTTAATSRPPQQRSNSPSIDTRSIFAKPIFPKNNKLADRRTVRPTKLHADSFIDGQLEIRSRGGIATSTPNDARNGKSMARTRFNFAPPPLADLQESFATMASQTQEIEDGQQRSNETAETEAFKTASTCVDETLISTYQTAEPTQKRNESQPGDAAGDTVWDTATEDDDSDSSSFSSRDLDGSFTGTIQRNVTNSVRKRVQQMQALLDQGVELTNDHLRKIDTRGDIVRTETTTVSVSRSERRNNARFRTLTTGITTTETIGQTPNEDCWNREEVGGGVNTNCQTTTEENAQEIQPEWQGNQIQVQRGAVVFENQWNGGQQEENEVTNNVAAKIQALQDQVTAYADETQQLQEWHDYEEQQRLAAKQENAVAEVHHEQDWQDQQYVDVTKEALNEWQNNPEEKVEVTDQEAWVTVQEKEPSGDNTEVWATREDVNEKTEWTDENSQWGTAAIAESTRNDERVEDEAEAVWNASEIPPASVIVHEQDETVATEEYVQAKSQEETVYEGQVEEEVTQEETVYTNAEMNGQDDQIEQNEEERLQETNGNWNTAEETNENAWGTMTEASAAAGDSTLAANYRTLPSDPSTTDVWAKTDKDGRHRRQSEWTLRDQETEDFYCDDELSGDDPNLQLQSVGEGETEEEGTQPPWTGFVPILADEESILSMDVSGTGPTSLRSNYTDDNEGNNEMLLQQQQQQ